jgi:hypothetical protein
MKVKKIKKFHVIEWLNVFLRAEGFSCSLGVLHAGLGISKLQFVRVEYIYFEYSKGEHHFFNFFFSFYTIKIEQVKYEDI